MSMPQPFPAAANYVWTGVVFAYTGNPVAGSSMNLLSPYAAAVAWGIPNPERFELYGYEGTPTPAPTPTQTYGMDENGNIGPISQEQYLYSQSQADAGAQMLADQLIASGSNPYNAPATVTDSTGQVFQSSTNNPRWTAPAPAPAPAAAPSSTADFVSADAQAYYDRYPELQSAYRANTYGMNPTIWAQTHYENFGAAEGRTWGVQANEISQDYLFPVGSTNTEAGSGAIPGSVPIRTTAPIPGASNMSFQFTQSAFNDPAAYAYMARYPDVLAAYRANSYGMTPDAFARAHYERFGVPERRTWGGSVSATQPPAGVGGGILPIAAAVAALFFLG